MTRKRKKREKRSQLFPTVTVSRYRLSFLANLAESRGTVGINGTSMRRNDRRKSKISRKGKIRRERIEKKKRKEEEERQEEGTEKRGREEEAPGKPERIGVRAYIKGSYRDKGINTSTKCGEPGRSIVVEIVFARRLSPRLSRSLSPRLVSFSRVSVLLYPVHTPVPGERLSLSAVAGGSSRYSIPVARQRFVNAIPLR